MTKVDKEFVKKTPIPRNKIIPMYRQASSQKLTCDTPTNSETINSFAIDVLEKQFKEQKNQQQKEEKIKEQNNNKNKIYKIIFCLIIFILFIPLILFFIIHFESIFYKQQVSKQFDELPLTYRALPQYQGNFEDMTLLDLQAKGSHNSYVQTKSLGAQIEFDPKKPYNGGCINIELDMIPFINKEGKIQFSVAHLKEEITEENQSFLSEQLNYIEKWHQEEVQKAQEKSQLYEAQQLKLEQQKKENLEKKEQNWLNNLNNFTLQKKQQNLIKLYETQMLPIILSLDLKESNVYQGISLDEIIEAIDSIIKQYIPLEKIYTPYNMLMQDDGKYVNNTLLEIVQNKGFPKLTELMGKYLIIITGKQQATTSENIKSYYQKNPIERIGFVDIDSRSIYNNDEDARKYLLKQRRKKNIESPIYKDIEQYLESNPNSIILNQSFKIPKQTYKNNLDRITQNIQDAKNNKLLTRGWYANDRENWEIFKDLGVNILTTDNVFQNCWTVLNDQYFNHNCLKQKKSFFR